MYLQNDGSAKLRNGMNAIGSAIPGTAPLYLHRFYQDVQNGNTVTPETTQLVGVFQGALYTIPYPVGGTPTSVGSVGGASVATATFARIQNPNNPNYPAGLTDCSVICTGVGGPYVWDGTHLYAPAGWASASGAKWCKVVNGILWFGGIRKYPNQIFGTGDGILQSMETLPAIRNFVLSSPVFGLTAIGSGANAALVVGLNEGVSVLYGTGPSTFYRQDVPMNDGVSAGMSMVTDGGRAYWLGHRAVYVFDGTSIPQQISRLIEPWILNDPVIGQTGYPMTASWDLSWSAIYNNRLHLGYSSNSSTPNVVLCFDLIVKGWTLLRPTPGLASMIVLDAPSDANPYVALVGSATTGQTYQWDYLASPTSTVTDAGTAVLAQVQSKFFKLGIPGTYKALQRFYPEFLVCATFSVNFSISTDYGNTTTYYESVSPNNPTNVGVWDSPTTLWDNGNVYGGAQGFVSFNAPASRIDLPGIQADAFSFGVQMTTALAPWTWRGGTGSYSQRGRT